MKKQLLKKTLAIALSLAMAASLAGCGDKNTGETTGKSAAEGTTTAQAAGVSTTEAQPNAGNQEVTTITLYPGDANLQSGLVGGYKGDLFAEHGFALDVWAYSDEKTNAILASGDMPDVMYVTRDNLEVMIEAGMVLNLDDYMDKLPHISGDEQLEVAMNYAREYESAGTGKLYGMPTTVGGKTLSTGVTKNMLVVNWEYYKGIGAPEFKDQWELIDVMKQMMEKYPVGEDGVENWGTYLNAGSDADYWANITQYMKWFGYEPTHLKFLLETDMVNGEYHSILEDNSKYREGLKWYNTVYREGLMDPDSINNDRQTQKAKVDNKHAMVTSGTLQGYSGYQPIYMPGTKIYQESWNSIYGTNTLMVINAKSKNIDAALAFIDMMADPDAYMRVWMGEKGDIWYVEDGIAYLRQDIIDNYGNGEDIVFENGEVLKLWSTPWVISDSSFLTSYKGPDGNNRAVRLDRWFEIEDKVNNTPQQQEWRDMTGFEYYVDQVMDAGNYYLTSDLDYVANFASIPDDMMQLTLDAIKDVVVNASWQMVYAESDEQFDAIWDQMVEDCINLEAQDMIDWRLNDLEQARATRDALSE